MARNVFFSFHYDDIMRVNNVRKCGEFRTEDNNSGRDVEGFYDRSLWETKKRLRDDLLKDFIRGGVDNTSAVCVLVGTNTWARRWVRYEIARAVIDNRGLLTVFINSLNHHQERKPHPHGPNPLDFMGIGSFQANMLSSPQYYIFQRGASTGWVRYEDFTNPVSLPAYLSKPAIGYVTPLSHGTARYDYISQTGHRNIGSWIDQAALAVGR